MSIYSAKRWNGVPLGYNQSSMLKGNIVTIGNNESVDLSNSETNKILNGKMSNIEYIPTSNTTYISGNTRVQYLDISENGVVINVKNKIEELKQSVDNIIINGAGSGGGNGININAHPTIIDLSYNVGTLAQRTTRINYNSNSNTTTINGILSLDVNNQQTNINNKIIDLDTKTRAITDLSNNTTQALTQARNQILDLSNNLINLTTNNTNTFNQINTALNSLTNKTSKIIASANQIDISSDVYMNSYNMYANRLFYKAGNSFVDVSSQINTILTRLDNIPVQSGPIQSGGGGNIPIQSGGGGNIISIIEVSGNNYLSYCYVSKDGSDNNLGTHTLPFQTLLRAMNFISLKIAQTLPSQQSLRNYTIFVADGVYDETVYIYENNTNIRGYNSALGKNSTTINRIIGNFGSTNIKQPGIISFENLVINDCSFNSVSGDAIVFNNCAIKGSILAENISFYFKNCGFTFDERSSLRLTNCEIAMNDCNLVKNGIYNDQLLPDPMISLIFNNSFHGNMMNAILFKNNTFILTNPFAVNLNNINKCQVIRLDNNNVSTTQTAYFINNIFDIFIYVQNNTSSAPYLVFNKNFVVYSTLNKTKNAAYLLYDNIGFPNYYTGIVYRDL